MSCLLQIYLLMGYGKSPAPSDYPSVLVDEVLSPSSNTTPLYFAVMLGLGLPLLCQWNSSYLLPVVGGGARWEGWRREEGRAFPASIVLIVLLQTQLQLVLEAVGVNVLFPLTLGTFMPPQRHWHQSHAFS